MSIVLKVCNRKYDATKPYEYIGRPSLFGNPFIMRNYSDRERNSVCDDYAEHFLNILPALEARLNYLIDLAKQYQILQLVCHCAPLRCHGDTIINYIKDKLSEEGYDVIIEKSI